MGKTSGVNVSKIRGLMAEHGETYQDLAKLLNVSERTLVNRMNGINEFKASEINELSKHYQVDNNYFFY